MIHIRIKTKAGSSESRMGKNKGLVIRLGNAEGDSKTLRAV